ncbi:MAG TPA: hypothetical protein PKO06_14505, partial [Candidatus Ozemobacteraceae bacterium]|nr:hypothetical protein [Candidatus Ozemobacteraceae bacterium]
ATGTVVLAYAVAAGQAQRLRLVPLFLDDDGNAVVEAASFPNGLRLARLPYLQQARWPQRLAVREEDNP